MCVSRYEVKGCEVVWAIRHDSICRTFVDEGAAVFFLPHLLHHHQPDQSQGAGPVKRAKYVYEEGMEEGEGVRGGRGGRGGEMGSALGPDWQTGRQMRGVTEVINTLHDCHMTIT